MTTQTLHVTKAVRSNEAVEELLAAVASADLVVLSFPLYVDCLPAPVIRALELIAARRAAENGTADATGDGRRRSTWRAYRAGPGAARQAAAAPGSALDIGDRRRAGIAPPPLPKRSRIVSSSGTKACTLPLRIARSHIGSSFFQPPV